MVFSAVVLLQTLCAGDSFMHKFASNSCLEKYIQSVKHFF